VIHTFIPDWPVLAAFLVASTVLAITPGPDMTLFLSKTVSQSRAAGFASLAGTLTGVVIHSVLIAVGLSAVLAASATAFLILKAVGALYLVYLAFEAIRHGSSLSVGGDGPRERYSALFAKGLMVNLLNPKVIIFFLTFLPQFVSPSDPYAGRKLLFLGLVFAAVNVPVCVPIILSADRIAAWLRRSPRATRVVDWLFAGVLGAFAARLILAQSR
jgi:threonine/homoserine/homoserine lactone efflux protein